MSENKKEQGAECDENDQSVKKNKNIEPTAMRFGVSLVHYASTCPHQPDNFAQAWL